MGSHIGVFDSGIGGLSVLAEIHRQAPDLSFSYIADSAFNPYGNKTKEQIIERCHYLTQALIKKNVDLIVVACNTATAFAIEELRQSYQIPIVAMEPAIKPAAEQSKTGKVLILATSMTLSSDRYYHLLERFSDESEFVHQACPGLVEIIENMEIENPDSKTLVEKYIQPALKDNVDSIVLGCTHYPFIKGLIKEIVDNHVSIIETSEAVTRQVLKKIKELTQEESSNIKENKQDFYTTGELVHYEKQVHHYWDEPVGNMQVKRL